MAEVDGGFHIHTHYLCNSKGERPTLMTMRMTRNMVTLNLVWLLAISKICRTFARHPGSKRGEPGWLNNIERYYDASILMSWNFATSNSIIRMKQVVAQLYVYRHSHISREEIYV